MVIRINDKNQNYNNVTKLLVKPNKNKIFIELFENLNQGFHNVKIYRNINKRDFKANYLQIKILDDEYYGYIGIYGDDSDDYFKFLTVNNFGHRHIFK